MLKKLFLTMLTTITVSTISTLPVSAEEVDLSKWIPLSVGITESEAWPPELTVLNVAPLGAPTMLIGDAVTGYIEIPADWKLSWSNNQNFDPDKFTEFSGYCYDSPDESKTVVMYAVSYTNPDNSDLGSTIEFNWLADELDCYWDDNAAERYFANVGGNLTSIVEGFNSESYYWLNDSIIEAVPHFYNVRKTNGLKTLEIFAMDRTSETDSTLQQIWATHRF